MVKLSPPVTFFLGIDGGGTKTQCVVGDETRVLGSARAGGCNIVRVGEELARKHLHAAIHEACRVARIMPQQVATACVGVAGVTATGVPEKIKAIVAEALRGQIEVVGDMDIALEAAFGDGPGVIVIAGTGSIALGRDKDGRTARVGGWGYAISDEGSAYWIGRELVRRALHKWTDGDSALPALVRNAWNVHAIDDVVRLANASPPPDFAALFPALMKAANDGDSTARGILQDAAMDLAVLAEELIGRLWGPAPPDVQVATAGGVFAQAAVLRDWFFALLGEWPTASIVPVREVVEPVQGALTRARRAVR